jgi:hypothetical protein
MASLPKPHHRTKPIKAPPSHCGLVHRTVYSIPRRSASLCWPALRRRGTEQTFSVTIPVRIRLNIFSTLPPNPRKPRPYRGYTDSESENPQAPQSMSTIKQIQANRLNAKKSTGPRYAEGQGRQTAAAELLPPRQPIEDAPSSPPIGFVSQPAPHAPPPSRPLRAVRCSRPIATAFACYT